jgi:integrase/recombinase XerD
MSYSYKYYSNPTELLVKELRRRRYSPKTIKSYVGCVERFLKWSKKPVNTITKKDVKEFLEEKSDGGNAGSGLNVYLMAIKFYFEEILGRKMWIDIKYSKVPRRIQRFLTKEEIERLLKEIKNSKHKIMIAFMYSAGLRVSELTNIKIQDLNFNEMYGFVRNGKGKKDRVIVIAERLEVPLKFICQNRNPEEYVFLTNRNERYSVATIRMVVKKAVKNAKIKNFQEVHPHTFRHSFATHLIQNNYSISDVQASLGHKSPETTMIYTHSTGKLIGIKSPFDY